jgi:phosphoribosylamine--glycine ligase
MQVLVVGRGGREHALAWKLAQSPRVSRVFAAPGSPGIGEIAECLETIDASSSADGIVRLADFAVSQGVDLTVVGPEDVLSAGIVDEFTARDLRIFGPTATAARLESSKRFAKDLMQRLGVPTAAFSTFSETDAAIEYVRRQGAPIVVKADGLAAGKGVIVARTEAEAEAAIVEILEKNAFGDSGRELVIEEFMEGEEASLFAIADGESYVLFPTAQDHKAIFDGDTGPNTGGMGAYSPAPVLTPTNVGECEKRIIQPVLNEMKRLGTPFHGVLFCGLMFTEHGPKVVEFNVRFGDPEAQVVLPLLKTDLVDVLDAAAENRLSGLNVEFHEGAAVCVVIAAAGYPKSGAYATGREITGLDELARQPDLVAFHAGTRRENGSLVTDGGRVVGVTARAESIAAAVRRAYEGVNCVGFEDAYFRRDIGHRALNRT